MHHICLELIAILTFYEVKLGPSQNFTSLTELIKIICQHLQNQIPHIISITNYMFTIYICLVLLILIHFLIMSKVKFLTLFRHFR